MNLLRGSSALQVKKALNILLGAVIKEKMNVSFLYISYETETLKMVYKPKDGFSLSGLYCCIM